MWVPIQLPPGVVRQATPNDTPGRWWDTNLVRWQSGNMVPVGGWSRLTSAALGDKIRKIRTWVDNSGQEQICVALNNGIGLYTDTYNDVTPASFVSLDNPGTGGGYGVANYGEETYGTARSTGNPVNFNRPRQWTLDNFGQDLLAVASSDGRLFSWSPPTIATMSVVTGAPAGNNAVVVTAERMVMLIGANGSPRQVAWSDREVYSGAAAWDYASLTTTAGFMDLEVASPLVTGIRCKDGVLVLSNREAVLMRYVGLPFIYGAENLGKTTFRGPNFICNGGGMTVWLGDEGFWVYGGGTIQPLPCPVFNDITENMDKTYAPYRGFMSDNGVYPEIWMFYPSTASVDGENDRYVIWNYAENWWARGSLARTAMYSPGPSRLPYLGGHDNHLYAHEDGWTAAGVSRVGTVWAETAVLDAGQQSGDRIKHVTQAMIGGDVDSNRNYKVTFKARYTPNGTEYDFGPYTPRADGYMDTRVTGRDIRMRIEQTDDAFWAVGASRLDVRGGGKR